MFLSVFHTCKCLDLNSDPWKSESLSAELSPKSCFSFLRQDFTEQLKLAPSCSGAPTGLELLTLLPLPLRLQGYRHMLPLAFLPWNLTVARHSCHRWAYGFASPGQVQVQCTDHVKLPISSILITSTQTRGSVRGLWSKAPKYNDLNDYFFGLKRWLRG